MNTKEESQGRKLYNSTPKAWQLDMSVINEGYLYEEAIVIANTRGKAKSKFLRKFRDSMVLSNGEELSFTKIYIFLRRDLKPTLYDGEWITKAAFDSIMEEESRKNDLELLRDNESVKYCFIKKRGMFYRENSCGYTHNKLEAGVYTKKDALAEARHCSDLTLVSVDVNSYNTLLKERVEFLKSKLLNTSL